jgi:hypothetical protein
MPAFPDISPLQVGTVSGIAASRIPDIDTVATFVRIPFAAPLPGPGMPGFAHFRPVLANIARNGSTLMTYAFLAALPPQLRKRHNDAGEPPVMIS